MSLLVVYLALVALVAGAAWWVGRRLAWVTIGVVAILPLVVVSPGLFRDTTPVPTDHLSFYCPPWKTPGAPAPHNATLSDFASQFAPWAKAVRLAYKERSLPWRDRWNGGGMPLAANGQSSAFSPFTLLMLLLPLPQAFTLLGAGKLLVAMTGMYLWLAEVGLSPRSARFGGIIFGLSFAITPWLYHPASAGIALWPWVLFAIEHRGEALRRRAWWLLLLVLIAWPLCGHLESVALGTVYVFFWVGLRLLGSRGWGKERLPRLASAGVFALGLTSVLLVPQLLAVLASNRLVLTRDPRHFEWVPWVPYRPGWLGALSTWAYPRAYGDSVATPMYPGAAGSIVEMGFGYIGLAGWACALAAGSLRRSRAIPDALSVLVLSGLAAAMGLQPFRGIVGALPGIGSTPPLRFLLFVGISAAALAAFGLERLTDPGESARHAARALLLRFAALAILAAALFLRNKKMFADLGTVDVERRTFFLQLAFIAAGAAASLPLARLRVRRAGIVAALTVVAAAQLLYEGMRLYRFYPAASFYPKTPLLDFLASRPRPFRVIGDGLAIFPNTNVFATLEEVRTHDPSERRDYIEFLDATCGYTPTNYVKQVRDVNSPALDFLNVGFLVAGAGSPIPGPKWHVQYTGADGSVFANADVLPRFFAPAQLDVIAPVPGTNARRNATTAFGRPLADFLAAGRFGDRALLLATPSIAAGRVTQDSAQVSVTQTDESTNRIILAASVAGAPALVVGSIVQDGGWTAKDERELAMPTTLANGPFLAFRLPSGTHQVTLTYRPPGLTIGATISAATALTLLAAAAMARLLNTYSYRKATIGSTRVAREAGR